MWPPDHLNRANRHGLRLQQRFPSPTFLAISTPMKLFTLLSLVWFLALPKMVRSGPKNPLTREQGVSIVMEAASQVLPTSLLATIPQSVFSAPLPPMLLKTAGSALKIAQAKSLDIVAGDFGTGNFRPTDNLSRAEYNGHAE